MMLLTHPYHCIGIVHVLTGLEWISMNLSSWLKMVKLSVWNKRGCWAAESVNDEKASWRTLVWLMKRSCKSRRPASSLSKASNPEVSFWPRLDISLVREAKASSKYLFTEIESG